MGTLDRLWAPWRSGFVSRQKPSRKCIFCVAKQSKADRKHHVVARGRHSLVMLNRFPYNNGHVMIAPYRHVGTLSRIFPQEWEEFLLMSQRLIHYFERTLRPHGLNVGMNLGRVAGAGIPGHLHLHIVPRWNGDTNFMPVLGKTKVMPQSLDQLYDLLAGKLDLPA